MKTKVTPFVYANRKDALKLLRQFDITLIPYAVLMRTQELADAGVIGVDNRGRVVALAGLHSISDQSWNQIQLYVPASPDQVRELSQPFISQELALNEKHRMELMRFLLETSLGFRRQSDFIVGFSDDAMFSGFLRGLKMQRVGKGYFPAHLPKPSDLYIAGRAGSANARR